MSDLILKELIETRINANAGGVDVAFENVQYSPINGRPYQFVSFLPAQTEDPEYSTSYKRLVGVVQVMLFYPIKAGAQAALARAEAIKAAFPRGLSLQQGGVTVRFLRSAYSGVGRSSAVYYELPVTLPYVAEVQV